MSSKWESNAIWGAVLVLLTIGLLGYRIFVFVQLTGWLMAVAILLSVGLIGAPIILVLEHRRAKRIASSPRDPERLDGPK